MKDLKLLRFYLDWTQTPYKEFAFSGHPMGHTEGFPYSDSEYTTVNHGTLQHFYISSSEEIKDEKGVIWKKVYEENSSGNPYYPGHHISIWVQRRYLEKVEELEKKEQQWKNLREKVREVYLLIRLWEDWYTPRGEEEVCGVKPPDAIWRHMKGLLKALEEKGGLYCQRW